MFKTDRGLEPGYLGMPARGAGPGVLVLHAWWGLTPFFKGMCDRLAQEGFAAFAPDLFGGKTADTPSEAEALAAEQQRDADRIQSVVTGALEELARRAGGGADGVAVLGFSFGAAWALELSTLRPQEVSAVVVFYGAYAPDFSNARAAYLGHFAENDPWEPIEGVRETEAALRAAGREVTFHVYPGVGHWFFESDRPDAYDKAAAELAWQRTVAWIGEKVRG